MKKCFMKNIVLSVIIIISLLSLIFINREIIQYYLINIDCLDNNLNIMYTLKGYISQPFNNELIKIKKKNKFGCINKDNEIVIPCIYDDINTNPIIQKKYNSILAKRVNKGYLIDLKNNILLDNIIYDSCKIVDDNLVIYQKIALNKYYYYFYNNKDNKISYINYKYYYKNICYNYSKLYFLTDKYVLIEKKDKYGVIDIKGKLIIPIIYSNIRCYKNHIVAIYKNHVDIYVDAKKLFTFNASDYRLIDDNYIQIYLNKDNKNSIEWDKYKLVNIRNNVILPKEYYIITKIKSNINNQNNLILCNDKYYNYYYNECGKLIYKSDPKIFYLDKDIYYSNDFINYKNKLYIKNNYIGEFDKIELINKDEIKISNNCLVGLIYKGKIKIPVKYEELNKVNNNIYIFQEQKNKYVKKYGYIDIKNNKKIYLPYLFFNDEINNIWGVRLIWQ